MPLTEHVALAPLHLARLHAYEALVLAAVAFGPFLVLAVVLGVLRRRDTVADGDEQPGGG